MLAPTMCHPIPATIEVIQRPVFAAAENGQRMVPEPWCSRVKTLKKSMASFGSELFVYQRYEITT